MADTDNYNYTDTDIIEINVRKCYRPDEVAEILGCSKRQVFRKINDPDNPIPALKISKSQQGNIRVPGKALKKWMEDNMKRPWEE